MILVRTLAAGAVALGLANAAFASDLDIQGTKHLPQVATGKVLNHHNEQVRTYPKFEHFYIKKFPQPSINCGACFGYYKTQWRSWGEACGEPTDVIITNTSIATPPVDPKTKVDPAPMPKVPAPMPLPNPAPVPAPVPNANPVPVPAPVPAPLPVPAPIPEPKKTGEGRSAEAPQKLVPATPVSISQSSTQLETPSIPLIPPLPVVNIK